MKALPKGFRKGSANLLSSGTDCHPLGALLAMVLGFTSIGLPAAPAASLAEKAADHPMTFMDVLGMRSVTAHAVSPDGKQLLYVHSVPDWKTAKSATDLWLVPVEAGAASARQMTFTKDKAESSPRWLKDSSAFLFLSNREAPTTAASQNQLYLMRPDGGEARAITEAKDGVNSFAVSKDGQRLVFSAGKEEDQQLWLVEFPGGQPSAPKPLTKHATPVGSWQFSPDSKRVYFVAPDAFDKSNKDRKAKKFDVRVRNEITPFNHLWSIALDSRQEKRLTSGTNYSVSTVTISHDSNWIGFQGSSPNRFQRNVTDASNYEDLYLLQVATGDIERLTDNGDISESALSFSPDSTHMAFAAADDFKYFHNQRLYLRAVSAKGSPWKKLGDGFDADLSVGFWSDDGKTIYFNEGLRATTQLCSVSVETGKAAAVTDLAAALSVSRDEDSKRLIVQHSSPTSPGNLYTVADISDLNDFKSWKQLTDANPKARHFKLGGTELVQWKSTDGKMVEGILVKPPGYEPGRRYPLVVQIHGGPQSAVVLNYNSSYSYYSQIYAAAGYVCLLPNYRGSSNYGEEHRKQISGDYFRQGYEDIMTGVDHLIATGLVDGDKMGVMGWSAGGHWSNWILTHTDRFKAISSGAGTVNWISMYAQSDTQRVREFYLGKSQPYDNFDHYWEMSPLKYIKNAKTPTLIHVVDGDPRVPRPQSEELHMALKKLGVPTELFVYPGTTHGITEPRNQLVKMMSEFRWFEKYVRGQEKWFDWADLLATLKEDKKEPEAAKPN